MEGIRRPGMALVAAAGALGPAVAGSWLTFLSLRPTRSRWGLTGLAVVMLLSAVIWMRRLFGFSLIVVLALVLLLIRVKGDNRWHSLTPQFMGVQACISIFLQIGYLFAEQVSVSGERMYSDTGQIAAALWLPCWFWAMLLTGLTLWLPVWSPTRALPRRASRG